MKNTTATILIGTILVIASIGTFFLEMITKDVLAGALFSIIVPCYMITEYQKFVRNNAKELTAKSIALATAEDYREIAQMEAGMERPIITRETAAKVERAGVFAS